LGKGEVLIAARLRAYGLLVARRDSSTTAVKRQGLCYDPQVMAAPLSPSLAAIAAADPAKPDYDENGVDLSLVRYSLSLTPTQRLKAVENFMNAMASVRAVLPPSPDSTK